MTIHKDQYEILASRRQSYDEMMWQAPVLSLTAQAFLLTIALGPGSTTRARLIASFLAAVAAIASVILMQKHRTLERECSRQLEEFEGKDDGYEPIHARPDMSGHPFWVRWSSHRIWTICLCLFAVAAMATFGIVATGLPGWFE